MHILGNEIEMKDSIESRRKRTKPHSKTVNYLKFHKQN